MGLQNCAGRLSPRFKPRVDVVSGFWLNTASGFNSSLLAANDPVAAFVARRHTESWATACLDDDSPLAPFVCHTFGVSARIRAVAFAASLAKRRPRLEALLTARGEQYVELEATLCALGPCSVNASHACESIHLARC